MLLHNTVLLKISTFPTKLWGMLSWRKHPIP